MLIAKEGQRGWSGSTDLGSGAGDGLYLCTTDVNSNGEEQSPVTDIFFVDKDAPLEAGVESLMGPGVEKFWRTQRVDGGYVTCVVNWCRQLVSSTDTSLV